MAETPRYGGPEDWLDYYAAEKQGATDQTEQDATLAAAYDAQWKSRVALLASNDPNVLTVDVTKGANRAYVDNHLYS